MFISRARGLAELFSVAFMPIPYFAISIYVCSAQNLGTAVRPHQPTRKGQQGGSIIGPRAPVCWLATHISVKAMFARSSSGPLSIWWRMDALFAVFAVCQFIRPGPCRSLGAPVISFIRYNRSLT